MQYGNETGNTAERKVAQASSHQTSVFWLVVGGLLIFVAAASILHTAGILTETGAEYAEDGLLAFIGALILWYAVKK